MDFELFLRVDFKHSPLAGKPRNTIWLSSEFLANNPKSTTDYENRINSVLCLSQQSRNALETSPERVRRIHSPPVLQYRGVKAAEIHAINQVAIFQAIQLRQLAELPAFDASAQHEVRVGRAVVCALAGVFLRAPTEFGVSHH